MTPEDVKKVVTETLTQLGADVSDPIAMQQDFARLREWRLSMDAVQRKATLTAIGILVSGIIAAVWLGLKSYLGGK